TSFDAADGLGHTRIYSVFADARGNVSAVSRDWIINRFDGKRFTAAQPYAPGDAFPPWAGQLAFLDRAGEWWLLTVGRGLWRFAAGGSFAPLARQWPRFVYTSRDGLPDGSIERVFEDARGDIWLATRFSESTLGRWERATGTFHTYSAADGLPRGSVPSAFGEDATGRVWIGFNEGGLARAEGGRFQLFGDRDALPPGRVSAIHLDGAKRLWVATSAGGVSRIDDPAAERPRFHTYTTAEGLSSNNVRCLTEDEWGRIYLGTARGITRLDPATGRTKHYTLAEGLASDFVTAAVRDGAGALWFGTFRGLSRLVPEPDRPPPPPAILIGAWRLAGVEQPLSELGATEIVGPTLAAGQNQVQIDFFGLGFSVGEPLRYQFKLEGADPEWSAPTEGRTVNYASLAPGAYRFTARAINADGIASQQPATLSFTILPPIWQRWWFILLAAAAAAFLIHAGYRYRLARLLELERVRTHIATDLHDDIGASLSRMAILSEVVKQQGGALQVDSRERLTNIAETARGLVDSMSDIVWATDPRRDDLRNVVLRVRQFAADVLEAKGIKWTFDTPPDLARIRLTPEQRRQLFLIFKEALTNIARHADCRTAALHLTVTHHQLRAEIHDDGRGFTDAPKNKRDAPSSNGRGGHGLENMRARAEGVGGRLEINSSPNAGTQITLVMPLAKTRRSMFMLFSRRRK
ncbi:MAG: sensor histidine kinase, partial [Pyrinomonadaceae bacterium]